MKKHLMIDIGIICRNGYDPPALIENKYIDTKT